MKYTFKLIFLLTVLLQPSISIGNEFLETDDINLVHEKALVLGKKYQPKNVLIVLDIDNTLLAMTQDLGSDQWFNWQASSIASGQFENAVAPDFPGLLRVQGQLFALSSMVPPQPEIPEKVKALQKLGFNVIALTSRGDDFRNSTIRELSKNKISFRESAIPPKPGFASTYLPYDLNNIELSGLSQQEAIEFNLGRPRVVSYMDGVFMVAGQHKGIMLKTLLKKTTSRFSAILFVDDHKKHCDRVTAVFGDGNVELFTVRYTREDSKVNEFKKGNKEKGITDWKLLNSALEFIFDRRSSD